MSGKYPNGGYRTQSAREHSTPASGNNPTVTATPVLGSGNSFTTLKSGPQSVTTIPNPRKYERLSDMGTKRSATTKYIDIDLGRVRERLNTGGSELGWQARDRMTGTHRIEIDLKGRDYKVNGRGWAMRQAIKVARTVLGVSRRIPKNLWSEILQIILELVLGEIERVQPQTRAEVAGYYPSSGWKFRSYGADVAATAQQIVLDMDQGIMAKEFVDARQTATALPVGAVALTGTAYDPMAKICSSDPAYFAAISGQAVTTRVPGNLSAGWWVVSNVQAGQSRFKHIASFRRCVGTAPLTFTTPYIRLQYGPYNAPYTKTGPKLTGNSGDPRPNPLPFKRKDVKISMPEYLRVALNTALQATELGDLIDSIYDALPYRYRYGRSYKDKMERIIKHWDKIDWSKAITNIAYNHFEDKVVGTLMGKASRQLRKTSINGFTTQYGVATGSGSSAFIHIGF